MARVEEMVGPHGSFVSELTHISLAVTEYRFNYLGKDFPIGLSLTG